MNRGIKKYQLYGLFCPNDNSIRYVGITTNSLTERLNSHLRKPTNHHTKSWFKKLRLEGKKPIINLIKECGSYDELLKSEIEQIKILRDSGIELYNIADGGDINPMFGKTHTLESRQKISSIHKGRKMTQEQKNEHRKRIKELWSNPEWVKMMKSKMKGSRTCNYEGKYNPNWKGGSSKCECGKVKDKKSLKCMSCRNISGERNPFFGKKHKPETIIKIKNKIDFSGNKNPNFKFELEKEKLFELYIVQNRTVKEISKLFNCCVNTVNNNLRKYKINKPNSNIYNLNSIDIEKYLSEGLNYVQIGKIYGCSNKIIHKFIKKNNLYVK